LTGRKAALHWKNWRAKVSRPESLAVTTGRADGGEHRCYRKPTGVDIRNDQNGEMARHIDVRNTGGFVVPTVNSRHQETI
jgi:hypothetical protein